MLLAVLSPPSARFYRPSAQANETVIYYAEGPSATVHVAEFPDATKPYRMLYVDSKSVAGTYDQIVIDQKMLAHLPLLLHSDPQQALTVGFGSGGTSYSMLQHRIGVECVEIEPRVPDAYRFFESENLGLVGPSHDRGDFRLVLEDARGWLHVTPRRYDAIVTDVTSVQYRTNGNLYTKEYFSLMQSRLTSDGLGCAWAPLSGIAPDHLRILVRTFRAVYPHTSVWYMFSQPTDFVILVGSPERLALHLDDWASRMQQPAVQRDLASIGMDSAYKLAAALLLAEEDVDAYVGPGVLHTDDRPVLEYLVHSSGFQNTLYANLSAMLAHRSDAARHVQSWPPSDAAAPAQETWKRWYEAAGHLMQGHAWVHHPGPERHGHIREAYRAAAKLVPEDATVRALLAEAEANP